MFEIEAKSNTETPLAADSPPQTDSDNDDFSQYVRRRTRRFFVGGFEPHVTENRIAAYVRSKGPTITKVSIFRNQRRKTTVVRVNVEDDEYAERLLFTDFWPRGITCRPWLSQGQYSNRMAARTDAYTNKNPRHSTGSKKWDDYNPENDVCDYNRYDALDSDVDVD